MHENMSFKICLQTLNETCQVAAKPMVSIGEKKYIPGYRVTEKDSWGIKDLNLFLRDRSGENKGKGKHF